MQWNLSPTAAESTPRTRKLPAPPELEAVIETARDHGGTVKDFAGDGALILVGAPLERIDHARAGLALARQLQQTVGEVTRAYSAPGTPLGVGVGAGVAYALSVRSGRSRSSSTPPPAPQ